MKLLKTVFKKTGSITKAITRFPVVFVLLIAIAVLNGIRIESNANFEKQITALIFAVFCFAVCEILTGRFTGKILVFTILYVITAGVSIGYYFLILPLDEINTVTLTRTFVAIFALFVAFILIPSIKSKTDFNTAFMNVFKAFFTTVFFSGIIWGGISLIISAIDILLFNLDPNAYSHTANIVWVVWAPILFLSLIPVFKRESESSEQQEEEVEQKPADIPRFLRVLLSYVLIPLDIVYTLVLILYIIKTIIEGDYSNNLLEPLILSYCISVLVLYILVSKIENKFTVFFRKVFPKVLIPIALFQLISSGITVYSQGLIHSRYFVIMFVLYSFICGIILSFIPRKKNGIIAVLAIVFALICITPYIDAFSVSYTSQKSRLINVLEKNDMLQNNKITPKADISKKDKTIIRDSVSYVYNTDGMEKIDFIPGGFDPYYSFKSTFGFDLYDDYKGPVTDEKYLMLDTSQPIDINGFDYFTSASINPDTQTEMIISNFTVKDEKYDILINTKNGERILSIVDSDDDVIISANLNEIFENLAEYDVIKDTAPVEKMTFDYTNSEASLRIVLKSATIQTVDDNIMQYGDCFIMFTLK